MHILADDEFTLKCHCLGFLLVVNSPLLGGRGSFLLVVGCSGRLGLGLWIGYGHIMVIIDKRLRRSVPENSIRTSVPPPRRRCKISTAVADPDQPQA